MSGWKNAGAFRLFLEIDNGPEWQLIYKNALYSPDQIPALEGLPVLPGPPEYVIQSLTKGPLGEFLPMVYWSQEVRAGTLYRYVWQDLTEEYRRPRFSPKRGRDLLKIAAQLPALQCALNEGLKGKDTSGLLRYDSAYRSALLSYAQRSLSSYCEATSDPVVGQMLDLWPLLSAFYQKDELQENRPEGFIHGDFNPSNMYVHAKGGSRIKAVDWEWAGRGVLHADLASLTKACDLRVQQKALKRFASQMDGLSIHQHWKWYRLCQLERGLLDASFLARQQMKSQRRVHWMPGRIQKGLHTVLSVYREFR